MPYIVSAIVSTFNSEKYITGCLDDLVSQTLYINGQLEIIVVNSGSEQGEDNIIKSYQNKYKSIKYIKSDRESLYAAWNRGINLASGIYLTNANTDDRHCHDAMEILSRALDEHPQIDLVYGDCYVSSTLNETFKTNSKDRCYCYPDYFAPACLLNYQFGPQPMWRRSVHNKIGYFDPEYKAVGDYDFNIRFALCGLKALHLNVQLGLYLEHDDAISFRDDTMLRENKLILAKYRIPEYIDTLYRVEGASWHNSEEHALIYVDLGNRAMKYFPAWESGRHVSDRCFAKYLYEQALHLDPLNNEARHNLHICSKQNFDEDTQLFSSSMHFMPEHSLKSAISPNHKSTCKILIACDHFWPSVGGTELIVNDIALRLIDFGYVVDVATSWSVERATNRYNGIGIFQFKCAGNLNEGGPRGEIEEYRRLIVTGSYVSVIILGHPDLWIGLGIVGLPVPRPRIIFLPSINAENIYNWSNSGLYQQAAKILRSADTIVTVTESGWDAKFLDYIGLKHTFIPHAVEHIANPDNARKIYRIPCHIPLLVMVANFWPVKNHLEFLHIISSMPGDWRLLLIGHPIPSQSDYFSQVENLVERDPRISITGGLPREMAAAVIRDADILLIPSKGESAGPLVLLQAMSFGTPWIATPECNAVNDEAGGIVASLNEFPKFIQKLLAAPDLANSIGLLGKEHWHACFTWEKIWPAFVDIIKYSKTFIDFTMPPSIREANSSLLGQLLALPSLEYKLEAATSQVSTADSPMHRLSSGTNPIGLNLNSIHIKRSPLVDFYCKGNGLEIGGSAHNAFGLDTLKVDISNNINNPFKNEEKKLCGSVMPVDIVAKGDCIPLPDNSQDFIVSSHVLEHFPNPVKALLEWDRLVRQGGIIFMIVPHRDRTFEKDRERTPLEHIVNDYNCNALEDAAYPYQHYHCWITEDVIRIFEWMQSNCGVNWLIEAEQDVDDKVGNGIAIVIRKTAPRNRPLLTQDAPMQEFPMVSVIAPTCNRAEILSQFLNALGRQTYPADRFEVIICNDGSTDATEAVLSGYRAAFPLVCLNKNNGGPASARNMALKAASGTIVIILNDDAIAAPDLIEKHVATHQNPSKKTIVLGSFDFIENSVTTPLMQVFRQSDILFQYNRMCSDEWYDYRYFWTCNISMPRIAFEESGFFDEDFREPAGEDTEIGYRLQQQGYSIQYHQECRAEHAHCIGFIGYCRRQVSVGKNSILMATKHPEITRSVTGLTDLASAEREVRNWLRSNEKDAHAVFNAIRTVADVQMDARQQAIIASKIEPLMAPVNHYFVYQGIMEGLEEFYTKRDPPGRRLAVTFLTPGTTISGGVKIIFEYCNRLAERGHSINLVTLSGKKPDWFTFHAEVSFITASWQEDHLIEVTPDADAVFATYWESAYLVARFPATKGRRFYLVQGYESHSIATPEKADLTYLLPLRRIVVSRWLQKKLIDLFHQKSDLVPNAIDHNTFYPEPAIRTRYSADEFRIGMLWNHEERKGTTTGLTAFDLLKENIPGVKLVLMGIEKPADLECDEFFENISGDEVRQFFCSLDLFVSTSRQEGFGLPGLEAMACGIPLVTTDSGGINDYATNGESALVVPPANPALLAEAITKVATDPTLRNNIIRNGKNTALRFNWNHSVTSLEKIVLSALGSYTLAGKMKVAVFSLDHPALACAYIRLISLCEILADAVEIKWGVTQLENSFSIDDTIVNWADIVVIQRFFPRKETWPLIEKILATGKPVVYETDDLLTNIPETNSNKQGADAVTPYVLNLISKVDAVTVSTDEMRQALSSPLQNFHILPNHLDDRLWNVPSRIKSPQEPVVIGYAGTPTHKADLALVEVVLERIAEKYGNRVAFCFIGCDTERIKQLPGFSLIPFEFGYKNYARAIQSASIDIGLVPLLDNPFNRCKSNIKWLEYSACGITGVYADLPPYNTSITNGETGILVSGADPDAWFAAIDELITSPAKRRAIAENARAEVLYRYNLSTGAKLFLKTYRQIISDYQCRKRDRPEEKIKVSVIILTWNRSRMLEACLSSLFENLHYTNRHQVIVGNSGSTDDTDSVVARFPIDVYVKKVQNIGLELYKELFDQATGEFIIVIDDDVLELPQHFDRVFESYFEEFPDYGYLGLDVVQNEMTNGAKPDDSFYRDDIRGERIIQEGPVIGCCAAIKRKTFLELDGFNGYHLSMKQVEDGVLCHKTKERGLRTGIIKGIRCFHASGPAYSQQFGYLERDIRKYEGQEMTDFAKAYRNQQDTSDNDSPRVSIIIPLFNKVDYTRHCLEALTLNTDESLNFEVILVDNASTDGTADYLLTLSGDITTITNKKNFGFAKAINQAAKLATGRYLVFLNNDTIPHPEWLPALIRGVERDNADIVGAKLVYPNGRIQHAGVAFDEESIGYHIYRKLPADLPAANKKRFMQCVTAACMLVKREIFTELNGFDEAYVNGFEDVDFCLRAGERGRIILYTPESVLIHFEETSEGRKDHDDKNMRRYLARWEGKVRCDDNDFYRIDGYRKEVIGNGRMRLHQLTPSPIPSYHSDDVVPTMINNAKVSLPDSEKATTLKGEGKFDKALDIFSRRLHRGDKSVLLEMGDCLASLGRFNEALAHYDGAHNFNPSDARAQVGIGVVNLLNGNYAEAAAAFSRALRASPTNSKALCGLGMARFGQGKHQEACELYKQSLENNPENATALHELIKSSYALDKYDDAVHYTQCYLMYHPLETDFLFSLAGLFYKQGGFRNVVDTLERLLIVSPEYNGASELLAKAHNELATSRVDRQPEAIAPDAAPQNYSGAEHKTKGLQQKEQGLFAEAIQSLTIVRDSGDLSVLAEIGDCLANLGNTDEALTMYQEALDRNSEDARALVGLGVINLLQEKLNKAVMFFNKALKSDSVNNRALAGLGMVRNLQGKPKEAFSFFSKALDLDPDDLNTLNNLLKIAYESDLLAEAEPYLRKYLMYHPLNNHILYSLAGLLYRVGNYSDALDNLDRLLVFEPSYEGGQELRSLLVTALTSDDTTETLATSR